MADGVAITPGVGATVATDDTGASGHVQLFKLAYSANGSAVLVPADADGLLVNLGANNDVTVSGVSTAANQATAQATLDTIQAAAEAIQAAAEALAATAAGTEIQADVVTSALPSGAASETTLAALLSELQNKLEAGEAVELGATTLAALESVTATISGTVPVSGTFWQATQPVSVASLPLPSGAATEATLDARTGALTETAPATDTASSGLNGRLQRIAQRLSSLIGLLPTALGAGGGLKVDGSGTPLPVSGTVTANIGTGTLAAVTTVSTVTNLSQLGGTAVAMNTGTRSAGTQRVTVATDDVVQTAGTVAEDQALSGNPIRNGARASTAIPSAMSADGDVVTLWADRNGALIAKPRPTATATLANVSGSASSVTLIASNTGRLGAIIVNDSSATCYLKYGSTASATSFTYLLQPGATWEMPPGAIYTGIITGIWTSATGAARTTELS